MSEHVVTAKRQPVVIIPRDVIERFREAIGSDPLALLPGGPEHPTCHGARVVVLEYIP